MGYKTDTISKIFLSRQNPKLNIGNVINKQGNEIFYQTTDYFRNGGIVELGISYSFNSKGKSGKKAESTFGKEQF